MSGVRDECERERERETFVLCKKVVARRKMQWNIRLCLDCFDECHLTLRGNQKKFRRRVCVSDLQKLSCILVAFQPGLGHGSPHN